MTNDGVSYVPADWIEVGQAACSADYKGRCDVQFRTGTKGAAMALHSEVVQAVPDGPEGPSYVAGIMWDHALEHRNKMSGRFAYRLRVVTDREGDDAELESAWSEVKEGDTSAVTGSDSTPDGMMALLMKMNIQQHNLLMRSHTGIVSVLESLPVAARASMQLTHEAIEFRDQGARAMLEVEREKYDGEADQREMEMYGKMFQQWMTQMQAAKTMNSSGDTITPPITAQDAAGGLLQSLTMGQMGELAKVLGRDGVGDLESALSTISKEKDSEAAAGQAQALLMRVGPHKEQLAPIFESPMVPSNIAAYQKSCLATLASAAGFSPV